MKKARILKLICASLATLMLILPVCSAYPEPDMTDPIEKVVRLGKYSSKIDPTLPFDESCVVLYLSKPNSAQEGYNILKIEDFPFLELESVERVHAPHHYKAPEIFLLNLKNPGRREVAEAIVAIENNLDSIKALKSLKRELLVPCPAISPKYDYLGIGEKFTHNAFMTWYDFDIPDTEINSFKVSFYDKPSYSPLEYPDKIFPEIVHQIDKIKMWSSTEYTVYLKSMDDVLGYRESMPEQWMRLYAAVTALNHRADDDIERIDFPDLAFFEGQLPYQEHYYTDYSSKDWYCSAVSYVINRKLMKPERISANGSITVKDYMTGEDKVVTESEDVKIYLNKFYPEMGMTRAMLVTVLFRMEDNPFLLDNEPVFDDVSREQWYYSAVNWAYKNGIIEGVGDNKFAPDREITREEFVTILYRYHIKWNKAPVRYRAVYAIYNDAAQVADWAGDAMSWSIGNHIVNGRDGGLIAPKATITRAEAAKILMRYDDYVPKK